MTISEKLTVTMKQAAAMALTTNACWYLQSCEFNRIKPNWAKAPFIGLGGNLLSFTCCMTAYTLTNHSYEKFSTRLQFQQNETQKFLGSILSGLAAAVWVIPGESRSVRSYVASEYKAQLKNKPLTTISPKLAKTAMWAGKGPTLGRDCTNFALIFYGGEKFDHYAQGLFPQIGKTGGAAFACACTSFLTVLLTNTLQHTRMNQQSNAWLRAGGRSDLATKLESWVSVVKHTYNTGGLSAVAFRGAKWRIVAIAGMQFWERVIRG